MIRAANVPDVRPHLLKPEATNSLDERGW